MHIEKDVHEKQQNIVLYSVGEEHTLCWMTIAYFAQLI